MWKVGMQFLKMTFNSLYEIQRHLVLHIGFKGGTFNSLYEIRYSYVIVKQAPEEVFQLSV